MYKGKKILLTTITAVRSFSVHTKTAVSDFTPQRLVLHRKVTLFNFSYAMYPFLYDYFKKTAVDTLGFLFYKVAHCLYFTLGGENLAVFGHTLSGFYLLLHVIFAP